MRYFRSLLFLFFLITGQVFGQNLTQTVRGVVLDSESEAPLIGVTVFISSTNPIQGAITDENGKFRIEDISVGRHTVVARLEGYEERVMQEVVVGSGKEVVLEVKMMESVMTSESETVKIVGTKDKTQPINEMNTVSVRSFSVEETKNFAAALNDPARMAQSFAGVGGGDDLSNEIVIRGNSPRGLLWRMEGIEIPNPNHFAEEGATGGGISMLSVNMLSNSDFLTGAFAPEYGNALSGVFDLRLRNGNSEKREYAFQAGILGVDFAAEGPFNKEKGSSYLINYRYSTLAMLNAVGIELVGDAVPEFQDLSFKLHFPTEKAGVFNVFGLSGVSQSNELAPRDTSKWDDNWDAYDDRFLSAMGVAGLSHTYFPDDKSFVRTILSVSGTKSSYAYEQLDNEFNRTLQYEERFDKYFFRGSVLYNRKINARNTIRSGFIANRTDFDMAARYLPDSSTQLVTEIDQDGSAYHYQGYFQWKHRFNENLSMNTGVHSLLFPLSDDWTIEPRAAFKARLDDKQSVTAGMGLHSKTGEMSIYFARLQDSLGNTIYPNKSLKSFRAAHFVTGYDRMLSKNVHLKIEAYYQHLYKVPVPADTTHWESSLNFGSGFTTDSLVNTGTGENFGLEITFERFFSDNFYYLVTASLYESRYVGPDGIKRNTKYNGNYIFNALAGKEFRVGKEGKGNTIALNLRGTYAGGQRQTPIDLAASRIAGEAVYRTDQAYEQKVEDYYRLDLRMSYKKNNPKATHIISLDIQNVTNHLNVFRQYYNPGSGNLETSTQMGLIPILHYRVEF